MLALPSLAAAAEAQSPSPDDLVVAAGTVRHVDADLIVRGTLSIGPGARLTLARGATLILLGNLAVPAAPIFGGEGRVDLTRSRVLAARPEWWGARTGGPGDCRPAFDACLAAHPVMLLGPGDYHVADTWTVAVTNRRIWGIGRTKDAGGTRILLTRGGDGTVMRIGTEATPPVINDYLRGIDLRWVELGRTAAASGDSAVGLRIAHVLDCHIEGVRANEHAIGYSIRGAVRTFLQDCHAFRSLASDPAGRDRFVGFDLDGTDPPIPTGANASLYLLDCNAALGGAPRLVEAVGAKLTGAMSDTVLTRFETTAVPVGIRLAGAGPARRFSQINVHLDSPVLDQCDVGIVVSGLGATAMIEIVSPYIALARSGRTAIMVERSGGGVRVAGGQLVGSLAADATGILIDAASGVACEGAALLGFARPATLRDARAFDLALLCIADAAASGTAVTVERCRAGSLRPRLSGPFGAYAIGVSVDAGSRGISVDTAGLDPEMLRATGSPVTIDGKPATASGSVVSVPFA